MSHITPPPLPFAIPPTDPYRSSASPVPLNVGPPSESMAGRTERFSVDHLVASPYIAERHEGWV